MRGSDSSARASFHAAQRQHSAPLMTQGLRSLLWGENPWLSASVPTGCPLGALWIPIGCPLGAPWIPIGCHLGAHGLARFFGVLGFPHPKDSGRLLGFCCLADQPLPRFPPSISLTPRDMCHLKAFAKEAEHHDFPLPGG